MTHEQETTHPQAADPGQPDGVDKGRLVGLAIMTFGAFIGALCQALVVPALPAIISDLGVDAARGQWMVTLYLLVTGVMIPVTGFLIDKLSARALFVAAMVVMGIGFALTGFATSYPVILGGRVLQAMSTGVLMPLITYVAMLSFPKQRRGEIMGYVGLVIAMAPALGPSVGGFATTYFGWQWVFRILMPVAFIAAFGAWIYVKDVGTRRNPKLDIPSLIMSVAGFSLVLYGLSIAGTEGWTSPVTLGSAFGGLAILTVFTSRQLRMDQPFLDLRTLKNRSFAVSVILVTVVNSAMISGSVLIPIYVQDVMGYTPFEVGLLVLPGAILMGFLNPVAGKLFDKVGARPLALGGLALLLVGTVTYMFSNPEWPFWLISSMYVFRMAGITFIMMPISTWGFNALPDTVMSHASSLNNTARQVAGSLGTALHITVLLMVVAAMGVAPDQPLSSVPDAALTGIHVAFAVSSVITIAAFVVAFIFVKEPRAAKAVPIESV